MEKKGPGVRTAAMLAFLLSFCFAAVGCSVRINVEVGKGDDQKTAEGHTSDDGVYVSLEEFMGWLPQGVMSVNTDPDSSAYYVRAIYEKDETFEEEKTYLIDRLQQERREYFAYGSRGSEAEDYQNRYSGQMVWIDGNAGLFLELGRQEGRACLLLRYEPDGILTADGTVDEVADHCFRMSFDELTDPASFGWIFMDDENYLLYPDPFAGLQVGDRVRIWYEDGRFGTAYENEVSIHIAAFESLPQE